jgi:hypothetical protein
MSSGRYSHPRREGAAHQQGSHCPADQEVAKLDFDEREQVDYVKPTSREICRDTSFDNDAQ